jgi:hypothetical protein
MDWIVGLTLSCMLLPKGKLNQLLGNVHYFGDKAAIDL